jgi:peptide/nickel transport system substrate-binding protein
MMDTPQLIHKFERLLPGASDLEAMVTSGLAIPDDRGVLQPILAESIPTIENRLWMLRDDGRMETTWKLRPKLRWHDGQPFTADDLVFTARLGKDPDLLAFRHPGFELVERIEAIDPQTAVVHWKGPYIDADTLFMTTIDISRITIPLPRHLLESAYLADKLTLAEAPYWTEEFVGTGPFQLRDWVRGSHVILEAFDGFALGRPRVDQIELRFIPDGNTLVASVLAGSADASLGRGLSLDQTIEAERIWGQGKMVYGEPGTWFALFPQFINPDPAVIANPVFRRALMHGMDRQAMADTLMYGLVPVAHSIMSPLVPEYREVEPHITKYDYSPRRAEELMRSLGYSIGSDGVLRDTAGRQPALESRTSPSDIWMKTGEAVADQWRRLGMQVRTLVVPVAQSRDFEYRAVRPGFDLSRRGTGMENLTMFLTSEVPLPERRYAGKNVSRYSHPDMDALVERYFATVPPRERTQVLTQLMRHMSEDLPIMPLFYDTEPSLVSNRVANYQGKPALSTGAWNVHLWEIR